MRLALGRRRFSRTSLAALCLLCAACDDGQGVDDDRCSGIRGDPYVPTACIIVRGTVRDPSGDPVVSARVAVDALRPEIPVVETAAGRSGDDGSYHIMVRSLVDEGGPGRIVVRVWDSVNDRRVMSDTVDVTFRAPGELANIYDVEVQFDSLP